MEKRSMTDEQAHAFMSGAPDGKGSGEVVQVQQRTAGPGKGRKKLISVTVAPALLARIDQCADRLGVSRAAAISLAMTRFADAEEKDR
jgi:hypothetical protein